MLLFSGTACFSPSVQPTLLRSWGMHGGFVARTYQERRTAQYYFCSGASDPWVARISIQDGLVVFDAAWIARCVREQFCVAIAPYVLEPAEEQGTAVHGKRRASERSSSSPAAAARAPKRARLGGSVPHLDLAAKYRRRSRQGNKIDPRNGRDDDFLKTIYDGEVGPKRFTVHAVLRSLKDVSVVGACVL